MAMEAMACLVEDRAVRRAMADAAFEEVQTGRFSFGRRRETMELVYGELAGMAC